MSANHAPTFVPTEQPNDEIFLPVDLEELRPHLESLLSFLGGDYQFNNLKEGGYGVVFFVDNPKTKQAYAIKTLKPKFQKRKEQIETFRKEVEFWIDLDPHPNVVTAYSFEVIEGMPFLFMEYVSGQQASLSQRLQSLHGKKGSISRAGQPGDILARALESQTLDKKRIAGYIHQVCRALSFASRDREMVHRDLKPDNILVTQDDLVKVTDFGLAYTVELTQGSYERERAGSWVYASPERFNGQVEDARSDIYSLGVILYQMCTGQLPYPFKINKDPKEAYQQLKDFHTQGGLEAVIDDLYQNPALRNVDRENRIGKVIQSCMHYRITDRYDSFRHLQNTLEVVFKLSSPEMDEENIRSSALHSRVLSLFRLKKHNKALALLNRLLMDSPDEAMFWTDAARIYSELGQQDVSKALLTQALTVDPEYVEAREILAATKG